MVEHFLVYNYLIISCHADGVWQWSLQNYLVVASVLWVLWSYRFSSSDYKLKPREGGWWKMTGFMALSLLSATNLNLNLALLMSSYTSLFLSSQDFSVWWGQIPPQRVHRGNANPSQEAEAQSNQEFQQLPGETVTCKFAPSHTHSCNFMLFKRDRVVVSWGDFNGAVLTATF